MRIVSKLEIGKKKVISLQNPIVKKFKKKEKSVLKTIPNKENKKVSTLKVPIVKKLGKKVTAEKSVLNKVSLKASQLLERLKSYKFNKKRPAISKQEKIMR